MIWLENVFSHFSTSVTWTRCKQSEKSAQRFTRYRDFKIERSGFPRVFFAKKGYNTEFSFPGETNGAMIFNHTKHILAQIAAKSKDFVLRNRQNGSFWAIFGPFWAKKALFEPKSPKMEFCPQIGLCHFFALLNP